MASSLLFSLFSLPCPAVLTIFQETYVRQFIDGAENTLNVLTDAINGSLLFCIVPSPLSKCVREKFYRGLDFSCLV